jgi:hypothetical protein
MKKQLKLPALLCALVFAIWASYWLIVRCVFAGDVGKSGQFGDTFGALNTLFAGWAFVAVLATMIQQWQQIGEAKREQEADRELRLRLDLYERRFRIYQATVDFIGSVVSNGAHQAEVVQFDIARSEAFFLFAGDAALLNYLNELRQRAGDLQVWKSQAKEQASPSSEGATQRDKLIQWFHSQLEASRGKFVPHLSFRTGGVKGAL